MKKFKISARDLLFFLAGIITLMAIEAITDWEGTKAAFKEGYEEGYNRGRNE